MKNKMIFSAFMALVLSIGISAAASATPNRYCHRRPAPRVVVRVVAPPMYAPRIGIVPAPRPIYHSAYHGHRHGYAHKYNNHGHNHGRNNSHNGPRGYRR